ncbi:MAG: hypothetical protein ACRDIB_10340, partial [Ardenticatenaceae bacterium]
LRQFLFPRRSVTGRARRRVEMDNILVIGVIVFVLAAAIVFGGYTYYKRNIEPGSESKEPDQFGQ